MTETKCWFMEFVGARGFDADNPGLGLGAGIYFPWQHSPPGTKCRLVQALRTRYIWYVPFRQWNIRRQAKDAPGNRRRFYWWEYCKSPQYIIVFVNPNKEILFSVPFSSLTGHFSDYRAANGSITFLPGYINKQHFVPYRPKRCLIMFIYARLCLLASDYVWLCPLT